MKRQPFKKVYSSVPPEVKEAIREEADRRGLQISDVIRELLMERYQDQSNRSAKSYSS